MTIIRICVDNASEPIRRAAVYVCLCNGVTEREIRQVAEAGCRTIPELTMRTGCGASCGSCLDMAARLLDEVHATRDLPMLELSDAA